MSYDQIVYSELELSVDHDYGAIQLLSNKFLSAVAEGKVDVRELLTYELAARGYDTHGNWLGLSKTTNPILARYDGND